jgi:hypothetical protein
MPRRRIGCGWQAAVEKKTGEKYPRYERVLESPLDASVIGDPEKTLRHVSKSACNLSDALKARGIGASPETVRRTLKRLGYKRQGNRKANSGGADHPDRDAQFQPIKRLTKRAIKSKNPVISVDTRKKEVLGAYKNGGKEWHKKGESPAVADHDCIPPDAPRPIRMAYTIHKPIPDLSRWEPTMIPADLPLPPYGLDGRRKATRHIRRRNICCSLLMAEVRTVPEGSNGNMSCICYRMKSVFLFGCAIIRPGQVSGTK